MNRSIALAGELAGRGHSVLFATQAEGRGWLRHPDIEHVPWEPSAPGDGGSLARHLHAVRGRASAQSNWFRSQALIVGDLADSYATVFTSLEALLRDIEPALLIVPQTLAPAIDLAHHTKRPLIIQTAFLPKAVRLHPSVTTPDPRSQATRRQRIESVWWFLKLAGANSAIEGMYWGRPILALPFMLDQPYYAGRVVDLSVGLQLNPRAFTSHDVRQAIGRLLHDRAFGDAAARLAQRLQRTAGLTGAADVVEAELDRQSSRGDVISP